MPAHVALLRGINLAGHNKVGMADLREVCAGIGLGEVATYIQSGNVVFSSRRTAAALTSEIESAIESAFGFEVPVVVRSAEQLLAVSLANPFVEAGRDPAVLSVGFLASRPEPARVSTLMSEPLATPPAGGDEFVVSGQEVFLHHPNGYGRTKLTNSFFDRRLGTLMTVRNWRTVTSLVDMTKSLNG